MKLRKFKTGFTLIELLVVITIIGLLAGLAIPAINGVLAKTRMTDTMSKLRQIGMGVDLYASENDGEFPNQNGSLTLSNPTLPDINYNTNWREAVHRYVDAGYKVGNGYNFSSSDLWYSKNAERISNHFGVNVFMQLSFWRYNLLRIQKPSEVVIIGEINAGAHFVDPRTTPDFTGDVTTRYRISHPNEQAVYLFADGHVEALTGVRHPDDFREMWRFD